MSKSISSKTRWQQLVDQVTHEKPDFSDAESNEFALTLGVVQVLLKLELVNDEAVNWVSQNGEFFATKILAPEQISQELQGEIVRFAENSMSAADRHSSLMQLVHATQGKKSKGVYYTPRQLARFVVRTAIGKLSEFGLPIDQAKILEPSVGTGIFVSCLIDELGADASTRNNILPVLGNLNCIDISPSAIVVAQVLVANQLVSLGLPLEKDCFPGFFAGNTLTAETSQLFGCGEKEYQSIETEIRETEYQLVLGNPPFGSLTSATDDWTLKLLHGQLESENGQRSYFEVDGRKTGERKSWLHDDYVKFVRLAHWIAERSSIGCIAFILNSGFLSNISFRGMRFHLNRTFEDLQIFDFGGDKRNVRDRNDENLFDIETGIAAMIATRCESGSKSNKTYTRLRGNQADKLDWCRSQIDTRSGDLGVERFDPECVPPHYFLDRRVNPSINEFLMGCSLDDLFQSKWSVPVTARDHLVVDWSPDRLQTKISQFLDSQKTDDEIRDAFFPPRRSTRYPRGDTRGWKLTEVRNELRSVSWQDWVRPCAYRPFDHRYVLWHPSMIDWPRGELTAILDIPDNQCLIARRQAPEAEPYTYFWSASIIPLDGILRSDNRGNEYCYPLLTLKDGESQSNISPFVLRQLQEVWETDSVSPASIFFLVQSLFHSTEYRKYFLDALSIEVPRVFFPRARGLAAELSNLGSQIIRCQSFGLKDQATIDSNDRRADKIQITKPKYENGELRITNDLKIEIPESTWNYRIGSHQVLKKFLAYRLKDRLTNNMSHDILAIANKIEELQSLQSQIDRLIADSGGLFAAFRMEGVPNHGPTQGTSAAVQVSR